MQENQQIWTESPLESTIYCNWQSKMGNLCCCKQEQEEQEQEDHNIQEQEQEHHNINYARVNFVETVIPKDRFLQRFRNNKCYESQFCALIEFANVGLTENQVLDIFSFVKNDQGLAEEGVNFVSTWRR